MALRELVTRLSFILDRTGLERFAKAISGFKTQMTLASAAVSYGVKKALDFIDEFAQKSIRIKDISGLAGLSVKQFDQLRQTVQDLGISADAADRGFLKLSRGIQEAKRGYGDILKLVSSSRGIVPLPRFDLTNAENFRNTLNGIFYYIQALPDEASKLQALGEIFDNESAGFWLRATEKGAENWQRIYELNRKNAEETERQVPIFLEFSDAFTSFSKNLTNTAMRIASVMAEVVTPLLEFINRNIEADPLERFRNREASPFNQALQATREFLSESGHLHPLVQAPASSNYTSQPYVITNSFTFNVPPGTTETQSIYMTEQMKQAYSEMMQESAREIINNNPQVE